MRKLFDSLSHKVHIRIIKMSATCSQVSQFWPNPAGTLPGLTSFAQQQLTICKELIKPCNKGDAVDLGKFMAISDEFPIEFGTNTCRVKSQPQERKQLIRQQIASAYPIIHELALLLFFNFLEHKQKFGNEQELEVYANMTLAQFVQRLLSKRCVYFFNSADSFMLMDGNSGYGGFEKVGTQAEKPPLVLKNVLSYDEIKLAALLYVSTHSEFINDGSRSNGGYVELDKSKIETQGIIMGLIGARFERNDVMECEDILITPNQNTAEHGYGSNGSGSRLEDYRRIWREFYSEPKDFCYNEVKVDGKRFIELSRDRKFDKVIMGKRYAISFDTLLLEAEARAVEARKPAFIHVVGIGLGVWKVSSQQEEIFFETFEQRLHALSDRLTHIGVVHFSWFHLKKWGGLYDGAQIPEEKHPDGGIKIHISVRNPADKLRENMLPVVTYAWDGNALPGNEFWAQMLIGTGDPAAACSTLISELQNPHINKVYMSGQNLHIASVRHGVLHIADYARKLIDEISSH